jgi:hypothetical protein
MSPGRVPKVPAARAQITLCGTTGWSMAHPQAQSGGSSAPALLEPGHVPSQRGHLPSYRS